MEKLNRKNGIKRIIVILMALLLIISGNMFSFAGETSSGTDDTFGQNNIYRITYKESKDGEEIELYNRTSSESSLSEKTLTIPAETFGITVEFDTKIQPKEGVQIRIMERIDGEINEKLYSSFAAVANNESEHGKLTWEGVCLDPDKEYVIFNFGADLRLDANIVYGSGSTEPSSPTNCKELFHVKTVSPQNESQGFSRDNPVLIDSAQKLYDIRNDANWNQKYYKLTADIDMTGIEYDTPAGNFSGSFDGDGHTISNLKIVSPKSGKSVTQVGLFSTIGSDVRNICEVKNLKLKDVQLCDEVEPATGNCGIIAGGTSNAFTLENVDLSTSSDEKKNMIYASNVRAGGLIGSVQYEKGNIVNVKNCSVENLEINDAMRAGALFGSKGSVGEITCTLEQCRVEKIVINGAKVALAGGFAGLCNDTIIKDCVARDIELVGNYASVNLGGGVGNFSGKTENVLCEDIRIILDGADMNGFKIGGFAGTISGGAFEGGSDIFDVKVKNYEMTVSETCTFKDNSRVDYAVGGFVGQVGYGDFPTYKIAFHECEVRESSISGLKRRTSSSENKKMLVAGFAPYINITADLDQIYTDVEFKDCSSSLNGYFGEITTLYIDNLVADKTLTISNTYYNAENGNETNSDLGELFKVSDFDISSSPSSSVEPTVPVTFGIEVVTDESVNADEDTESGEASETEKTDVEPMTNRDSATVSVQAYEAVLEENGNITKGDKIEGFFDAFPDAVSVENWTIIPYSEETPDAVSSDEGFTAGNTKVSPAGDSAVQAVLSSSAGIGTEEEPAQIVVSVDVNGETRTVTVPYRYVYVSSGGGGGSSSGNKTETVTEEDGTIVTTVTGTDGTVTVTTEKTDGSKEVVVTEKDGTTTTTNTDTEGNKTVLTENPDGTSEMTVENADGSSSVTVEEADGQKTTKVELTENSIKSAEQKQEAAVLPMDAVSAVSDSAAAQVISVSMPEGVSAKVEIPVENVTAGTVALIVNSDGTEDVIKTSVPSENGIEVMLKDGDTIKIIDNSKSFDDVNSSYWGADAVAFVTSRELFNGTGSTTFSPEGTMTRAMIVTVLARLEGVDTDGGTNWYDQGVQWAMANGISDGTNLQGSVSREQLATMLYRYAGSPAVSGSVEGFSDAGSISSWAENAMTWAVDSGLISGMGDGTVNSQGQAERAQVATILMRFIENIA